jgi:hypothetical protein
MNISRNFIAIASLYIILGVGIGMYMGGSGDHTLIPVHAHINLLGFVLPMAFGITYHLFPAAGGSTLAKAHFWLHQIGALILLVMLTLFLTGKIAETAMFPIAPLAELAVLLGLVAFAVNVWQHVR